MAPRAKTVNRAGADESEDDLATTAIHPSKGAKTTKAKTAVRRVSAGKAAAKRKVAPKQSRTALKDRTNIQDGNETEEVEDFDDEDMAAKPKTKRAKTTATTTRKNATARASKVVAEDDTPKTASAPKRGRDTKRAPSPEPLMTIPETQPDPEMMEDVEQSIEIDEHSMDIAKVPTPKQAQKFAQRAPSVPVQPLQTRPSARAGSAQPGFPRGRERSGSASGTERRGGDPELRRQLNEMTKKYENLQLKYENLQEIGKTSAESNFEKLKRASDQKANDANELIVSLKRELAEVRKSSSSVSSETTGLQKQVSTLTASNEKVSAERDDMKSKLQVSQNEIKSLEAKLTAARLQLSNSALEAKAQETAAKKLNSSVATSTGDAQKEAKMKENLYADLTGLIVRGVKRKEGEDEYDCIQTGRNGTLHFHLSIANDTSTPHPKTPSGLSYEDAEFAYEPLLDDDRDRELLDLLPDYLTEEICFPRNHAQRFYSKVVDSMTKKIVLDED